MKMKMDIHGAPREANDLSPARRPARVKRELAERSRNTMLFVSARLAMLVLCLMACGGTLAQSPGATLTTKVLAVGTLRPDSAQQAREILIKEVRATVELYLHGRIDQWYSMQDRVGVVLILNVQDLAEARQMLDELPMGRAGLMSFDLILLGPLNPLRQLEGTNQPLQ